MQGRVFCKFDVWVFLEFKLDVLNWTMLSQTNVYAAERENVAYYNAVVFLSGILCW
jgi:hypothetical protein